MIGQSLFREEGLLRSQSIILTNRGIKLNMYVFVNVCVCVLHLSTYPLRTPLSWGSGGGCHWTMMDWFVRPLATIFFGGALGASSLSINLTQTQKEREHERQIMLITFIRCLMRMEVEHTWTVVLGKWSKKVHLQSFSFPNIFIFSSLGGSSCL